MKRVWFLLSLCFAGLAHTAAWTLNPNLLEEKLPFGVTVEELVRVLEKEGIDVCFEAPQDRVLWRGGRISISLASIPFTPYHLWIGVEGKKTLDECTEGELSELYEAVWRGRKAVAEATGIDSFMIFTTEENRKGKDGAFVGFEVIPSGCGGGIMDAVEKNALNEYVFYNRSSVRTVSNSAETIEILREKLEALTPSVEIEAPQERWSQKLRRHKEALYQNLRSIHDALAEMGALVEGEMPPLAAGEESILEIQIDLDRCAFCNPKVIKKQIVADWNEVQILMSHKPISPYGNFLILPKRHQCAWDLSREEAVSSLQAVIALKKMFLETVGSNDWICYIQDGPGAGQTVPHTHIHFYLLPDPLKSAISGLQHIHNQRPILPYEEMRAQCEKVNAFMEGMGTRQGKTGPK